MALIGGKKGLLMTVLIMVLFMLMLAELFSFAILNIGFNSFDQQVAVSSASANYGQTLTTGAYSFANASLQSALSTLANYELNASMRKGNLVNNTSQYLSYLIANGTLPNVAANSIPANYLLRSMGNLTLTRYNASTTNSLLSGIISVKLNQTVPQVFQSSPYTLSVSYTQNIRINSTSGISVYSIPVNATISLNNTPDLFYYQQGIARKVVFGSLSNITYQIGAINATNGNTIGSVYGPVYNLPANVLCSALSADLPSGFTSAPYSNTLILVTANAQFITGGSGYNCANQYGGVITYAVNSLTSPPTVPWLQYPTSTSFLNNLQNGEQVLLYGPQLSAMNIQNLINTASNSYYIGSPFAPSYLDRAKSSLLNQSPNGIFTLSNYNAQAASFTGSGSFLTVTNPSLLNFERTNPFSISVWFSTSGINAAILGKDTWGGTDQGWQLEIESSGVVDLTLLNTYPSNYVMVRANQVTNDGKWHHLVATYDGSSKASGIKLYIDGQIATTTTVSDTLSASIVTNQNFNIGDTQGVGNNFNGQMGGVQIYGQVLKASQVSQLYQEGISGLPIPTSNLLAWWPLSGNANDYSGNSNNGVPTNVAYSLPANYVHDSILPGTSTTQLSSIPGLLSCSTSSQCASQSLPHLYLGYMPLELTTGYQQVATLTGLTNQYMYAPVGKYFGNNNQLTASEWTYVSSTNNGPSLGITNVPPNGGWDMPFLSEGGLTVFGWIWTVNGNNPLSYTVPSAGWYHLAITYNPSGSGIENFYVNGNMVASGTGQYSPSTTLDYWTTSLVGAKPTGVNAYLTGQIANVQFYNQSLTSNQIMQLYREGINGIPLPIGASGWWPLNGNINDYSGYQNTGVTSNAIFTAFYGTYNGPAISSPQTAQNEWQSFGLSRSPT
ncbi:MAG: LamG domain-containing protein [Candidatus Micrarchaeota archaeon]|nr:LamG domain-containing protein [Candidatus Micrarchaeota archaeon]MDE1847768.1 LamG domain-containing protein [Candidatus Micrarchaeota archaeon]MDE1863911.1 LamG domain-containing protein [Candidatus Micrarchaeota archaeon]